LAREFVFLYDLRQGKNQNGGQEAKRVNESVLKNSFRHLNYSFSGLFDPISYAVHTKTWQLAQYGRDRIQRLVLGRIDNQKKRLFSSFFPHLTSIF
jgi:hypothetical protein